MEEYVRPYTLAPRTSSRRSYTALALYTLRSRLYTVHTVLRARRQITVPFVVLAFPAHSDLLLPPAECATNIRRDVATCVASTLECVIVDEPPVDGEVRSVKTEEETRAARPLRRKMQENQRSHARAKEKKKLAKEKKKLAASGASETCDDSGEDATDSDMINLLEALLHMAKAVKTLDGKDARVKMELYEADRPAREEKEKAEEEEA